MADVKKIGILWGGGLGDLLMIRPLLAALQAAGKTKIYFLTTATHSPELFEHFCAPATVVQLPRSATELPGIMRSWAGFFDLLYLGPYPTMKTRLLARLLRPAEIAGRLHRSAEPFILEQVLRDCEDLGLPQPAQRRDFRAFLPWPVHGGPQPFADERPFLILHAGSKQGWETKQWPREKWTQLTRRLLEKTRLGLCFVGIGAEEGLIRQITAGQPAAHQGRLAMFLNLSLRDTAALIEAGSGVICHNSGILHLASFLGKKTLCLTGASARYWRPPYAWVTNITSGSCGLACNCYSCPVPFYRAKCIRRLAVDDVWAALDGQGLLSN